MPWCNTRSLFLMPWFFAFTVTWNDTLTHGCCLLYTRVLLHVHASEAPLLFSRVLWAEGKVNKICNKARRLFKSDDWCKEGERDGEREYLERQVDDDSTPDQYLWSRSRRRDLWYKPVKRAHAGETLTTNKQAVCVCGDVSNEFLRKRGAERKWARPAPDDWG